MLYLYRYSGIGHYRFGCRAALCDGRENQRSGNCAAYTNVDKAEEDEGTADRINRLAVENLAVVCKEANATLIHVSTDYVFGGNRNLPYREDEPTDPLGAYGRTKLAGEQAVEQSGCRYLIFRDSLAVFCFRE